MSFWKKYLVNTLVTVPPLILVLLISIHYIRFFGKWMFMLEQAKEGGLLYAAVASAFFAATLSLSAAAISLYYAVITGEGIFWRRVYWNQFLVNKSDKSGKPVHWFGENALIWRWNPIFRDHRLCGDCGP